MIKYILLVASILIIFVSGCGTPNDPESILGGDGGYKIVAKCSTSGFAQDIVLKDSLAYLAQGEGGLEIISVAEPSNPRVINNLTEGCRGYTYKISLLDTLVYLASGTFGITVVNTADPVNPVVTANNRNVKPAKDFHIFNNFLFTAISEEGVSIAEISYPAEPDIRGGMITPGYAQGVSISSDGNYALVAIGEMGLAFYDISQLQNGYGTYPLITVVDLDGYAENVTINPSTPLAYVACGTGGMAIVDFSDSTNIRSISKFDTGGYAKEVFFDKNKIYISTELRGLQIIGVSDPYNPVRIGTVETQFAKGITADGNYIYVADEDEGLIIISIPD